VANPKARKLLDGGTGTVGGLILGEWNMRGEGWLARFAVRNWLKNMCGSGFPICWFAGD
jgi:hypothetical protein